eukprot:jgi/Botrbrau1/17651/Bobra.0166s0079.1
MTASFFHLHFACPDALVGEQRIVPSGLLSADRRIVFSRSPPLGIGTSCVPGVPLWGSAHLAFLESPWGIGAPCFPEVPRRGFAHHAYGRPFFQHESPCRKPMCWDESLPALPFGREGGGENGQACDSLGPKWLCSSAGSYIK